MWHTLYDEVDAMSEDLADVEDYTWRRRRRGRDDEDDDEPEEYEAGLYEITCPRAARWCAWMRKC